jgi:hypothetical protein
MLDRRTLLGGGVGSGSGIGLASDEVGWLSCAHNLVCARDWVGESSGEAVGKAALLADLSNASVSLWDWGGHDKGSKPEGKDGGESHIEGGKEGG